MSVRVPTLTTYGRLERGLGTSLSRVQDLQSQLASGSRIGRLSDDPVGASTGLALRAQEASWAAYDRTAGDATAILGTTDNALQGASTLLQQVRQLAVSGNSGALNPTARSAVADQIANLRQQLVDVANTQHLGRAVFGGHKAVAVSATAGVYGFAGDAGAMNRQVSPSVTVDVNADGNAIFGFDADAGQDLFSVLGRLEDAVRSGDPAALATGQTELSTRTASVTAALGQVGAAQNRITAAQDLGRSVVDGLVRQRSDIEDVDLAQTVLRLQAAQNGYSAALGAVARADLPSLANFLH